jgi:hypothetical protein
MKKNSLNQRVLSRKRKAPLRDANCEQSASRKLKRGDRRAPPGDRGACEPESEVQGSE